jgi:hypothetical protein
VSSFGNGLKVGNQLPNLLDDSFQPRYSSVYPNPSNGIFYLQATPGQNNSEATLTNSLGQILVRRKINAANAGFDIRKSGPGIYFLHYENNIHKILVY